jgi:hypothetical protein
MPRYKHIAETYSSREIEIAQITKKKKQIDSMSNSGANEEEMKKRLSGFMENAGVEVTNEIVQEMLEIANKMRKSSSSLRMESSTAPSLLTAKQELNLLSKTAQQQVDSKEEGSDKKSKSEQVECAVAEEHATLESLPLSTVKEEPIPLESVDGHQSHTDSEEDDTD